MKKILILRLRWILLLTLITFPVFAQQVVFTARPDRSKIGLKEQVQVDYVLKNVSDLDADIETPDFGNFIVVGTSQSFNAVNGRGILTVSYLLQPRTKGVFIIKPTRIIAGGKTYRSNTVQVEVVAGAAGGRAPVPPDNAYNEAAPQESHVPPSNHILHGITERDLAQPMFIAAMADNLQPVVGQQVNVTYKLFCHANVAVRGLRLAKLPSLDGFWVEDVKIPDEQSPVIEYVNGIPFQTMLIKKAALFPQHDGRLALDEAHVEFLSVYGEEIVKSKPLIINVKSLPGSKPASFDGAVGKFTVSGTVNQTKMTTDDVGTLTFTVRGTGNIRLINQPALQLPESLKKSDPQTTEQLTGIFPGVTGQRTFTYHFNVDKAGEYSIPGIEFSYFDPLAHSYRVLRTDPISIRVSEGTGITKDGEPAVPKQDILNNIVTGPIDHSVYNAWFAKGWYWSLYTMPLLALGSLLVYRRRTENERNNSIQNKMLKADKIAAQRLALAAQFLQRAHQKDFYEEISKAVWLYLCDKLSIPIAELSKENISSRLLAQGATEDLVIQTQHVLSSCEMALYSPSGNTEGCELILKEASEVIRQYETVLK